jgi:CRP-like cAMP-binding protein
VAGQVRILKQGEILFRAGQTADSMYIVRRGSLKVYFLNGNEEVQLALLGDGAIVGEMAFFDQKPRSAHVKALTQTEITEITRLDFDKLLTQIPKWLVTMLQSLSGRLRTTNEKLAALEKAEHGGHAQANDFPFVPLVRTLRIFQLLIGQFGQKEGTTVTLDYQTTLDWWMNLTGWPRDYFSRFTDVLDKQGLMTKKSDDGKPPRLVLASRGRLQVFSDFVVAVQSKATLETAEFFGPQWIALFEAALAEAAASGYEAYNVPVSSIPSTYAGIPEEPKTRLQVAEQLAHWLQLKATKSNVEILLRVSPKDHKNTAVLLKLLYVFVQEKLDRID